MEGIKSESLEAWIRVVNKTSNVSMTENEIDAYYRVQNETEFLPSSDPDPDLQKVFEQGCSETVVKKAFAAVGLDNSRLFVGTPGDSSVPEYIGLGFNPRSLNPSRPTSKSRKRKSSTNSRTRLSYEQSYPHQSLTPFRSMARQWIPSRCRTSKTRKSQ